jgi:hypothetical protein
MKRYSIDELQEMEKLTSAICANLTTINEHRFFQRELDLEELDEVLGTIADKLETIEGSEAYSTRDSLEEQTAVIADALDSIENNGVYRTNDLADLQEQAAGLLTSLQAIASCEVYRQGNLDEKGLNLAHNP